MTIISTTSTNVTVSVADLLSSGHEAQHPAGGALHAIGGTLPAAELVTPLNFRFFRSYRTKLAANLARYQSFGFDLVPVLSDDFGYVHTYFPGDDPGYPWSSWETWVANYVSQLDAAGIVPYCVDIWNEPDLEEFWPRPFPQFCDLWVRTAAKIKTLKPAWKVCGPSLARYDSTKLTEFFTACQTAGIGPDVISFHQLAIPAYGLEEPWNFPTNLAATQSLAASFGFTGREFFLGEYITSGLAITRPGEAASWMVSMDAAGYGAVVGACHSVFTEKDYDDPLQNTGDGINNGNRDTICGLLSPDYAPRAKWFLYRDYATMSGKMASDLSASILVSSNAAAKEVRAIYCAKDTPSRRQTLTITGMGTAFSPERIMYQVKKYPDIAWSKCPAVPISEYGTILSGFDSITLRIPPFAAGTEALHFRLTAR